MNSHNKKNISNQIIKIPAPKPIFYNQLNKKHTITKKSALVTLQKDPCARWIVNRTLTYRAGTPVGLRFSGPIQNGREAHPTICTLFLSQRVKRRGVALTTNSLLAPESSIRAITLPHTSACLAHNGTAFTSALTYKVRVKQDFELFSNCNLLAFFTPTRLSFPQPRFLKLTFVAPTFCSES